MATQVLNQNGLDRAAAIILSDIDYCGVGTGTTDAAIAQTQLVAETARNAVTTEIRDSNVLQSRTFFLNSQLPSPDVKEAGWFMNASAAANNGSLICRSQFSFTKGTQDLLLILELTVQEDT